MRTPVQLVSLRRWWLPRYYSLPGGFWAIVFGPFEIRLRWPMASRIFVRERDIEREAILDDFRKRGAR